MNKRLVLAFAVPALAMVAAGPAPSRAQAPMTEQEYCDALVATYNRYLGQSSARSQFPDVAAGNAIADCQRGRPASGIPVLERKLRNAGFTLPVRDRPVTRDGF